MTKKQLEDSEWKLLIEAKRSNSRPSTKELEGKSVEIRRLWKLLIEAKRSNSRPSTKELEGKSVEIRRLWQLWDQLVLKDCCIGSLLIANETQLWSISWWFLLPYEIKYSKRYTKGYLEAIHLGEKTFQKLKTTYYWPGY